METESTGTLVLVAGGELRQLMERVLALFPRPPGRVVLAIANRELVDDVTSSGTVLANALHRVGSALRIIAPPAHTVGAWASVRSTTWRAVELPERAERLDRVWLPATIVEAESLIALGELPSESDRNQLIAIGVWALFAHPRQRTGARLSDDRNGLTAEIALAVNPSLTILTGTWRGVPLIIASDDQIVAELAGLAATQLMSNEPPDSGGPWEDPLVQRAAEIGVGILRPEQIEARFEWGGEPGISASREFDEYARSLLARIGLPGRG